MPRRRGSGSRQESIMGVQQIILHSFFLMKYIYFINLTL